MFLAISEKGYSQNNYSSNNKSATKAYEKALYFIDLNKYREANVELKNAIKEDANFIEAYLLLADVHRIFSDFTNAKVNYRKAFAINPDFAAERYFYLGEAELKTGDYHQAIESFNKYLGKGKPKENRKIITEKYIKDCEFSVKAVKKPVPFNPVNLGGNINTSYDEYMAALTTDENTIIFTRQINKNEDFYISHKVGGEWAKAEPLSENINTPVYNEGAQCISPDGQFLFFTGCNRPDGLGGCDIYVSQREGNNWSRPVNLGRPINTPGWESQPSLSSDGRTLYFTSNRKGGLGSYDIWKSTLNEYGRWTEPVNLGPTINTPYDEQSPFIHPDNETLYFSSSGWPGLGSKDLFVSRLDPSGQWAEPKNLGYPINTYGEESGLTITSSGTKALFSSNNFSGNGGFDIYSFDLPEDAKPQPVNYVKGKVFDAITLKPLDALIDIVDLKTGNTLHASYANKVDGTFLTVLPNNKAYSLNVLQDGYLFYTENFSTEKYPGGKPINLDVPLHKIAVGNKVILKNIFFDSNKFEIKNESKPELTMLIDFLKENPGIEIEIQGHTDNVGDDNSNRILSENRAKSVQKYLADAGIEIHRLKFKGFGKENPIADNATTEGRANNRRTEFVITKIN